MERMWMYQRQVDDDEGLTNRQLVRLKRVRDKTVLTKVL